MDTYGKVLLKQKFKQTSKQNPSKHPSKVQAADKHLLKICLALASQLSKHMPFEVPDIKSAIFELIGEKVLEWDGQYLVQKRMVKDAETSHQRSISGKKGGKQRVINAKKREGDFASDFALANSQAKFKQNHGYINNNGIYTGKEGSGEEMTELALNNFNAAMNVFSLNYETFIGTADKKNKTVTEADFNEWKDFVILCTDDDKKFKNEIFNCKQFLFPADFKMLKDKKGFTRDRWEPIIQKILSVGLLPQHKLYWRIPDAVGWLYAKNEGKASTDQDIKKTGGGNGNYSNNKFN